jgi:phage shock protein A
MAKGAIGRIADIIRADVDDVISRMEDPKKLIGQMILEMEDSVNQAITSVGRAVANEKLMERRISEHSNEVARWEAKAQKAVAAGEDELARKALKQKVVAAEDLESLSTSKIEAEAVTNQLKQQLDKLKTKLQEARSQQRTVIAKHQVSQRGTSRSYPSPVREDAFQRFDEFRQKVEQAEITAEVYEDVAGTHPALEADFEKMEKKQRIEEELSKLKDKTHTTKTKDNS